MDLFEILRKLKELQPTLEQEFSVLRIGVFGSSSLNKSSENSDIDLLVEFRQPIGWKFFTLEIFLERVFGRKIDLVTPSALRDSMKKNVLNQVVYP